VHLHGKELFGLSEEMRAVCDDEISMVLQEPMTSLTVGRQKPVWFVTH